MSGPDLQVSGGVGGIDAHYEDLATLGRESDDLALTLGLISAECHLMLADPNLLATAVLDPAGAARFTESLVAALDGAGGLTALSARFGQRAIELRAAAATYHAVDEIHARALDGIRWQVGHDLGPAILVAGVVAGGPLAGYRALGGKVDYERLLTDHPGIVDDVVGASPGLISDLPGVYAGDVRSGAHLVGLTYHDGRPKVVDGGIDSRVATEAPHGYHDLMAGLDHRDQSLPLGQDDIDVRVITHADGSKAYVVDIPGVKTWEPPGGVFPAPNDAGTNIHAMAGDVTTRERAIAEALHEAGANTTDPVMLVGHSQGGMVAAQAAHDTATGAFDYHVTHVMTAGAPIARAGVPSNVQVLALENSHDIVPHLDAADNPDRPNWTTVTFDNQLGAVGLNHSVRNSYLPAAQLLDASHDPSVAAYRSSAGAYLSPAGGATVRTHVYQLTRVP
jgi:hypothetical protein